MCDDDTAFAQEIRDFLSLPNGTAAHAKYLELAKKYHPDGYDEDGKGKPHERMVVINAAFESICGGTNIPGTPAKKEGVPPFDFHRFAGLFARYADTSRLFHRVKNELDESFARTVRELAREIGKQDKAAGDALAFLSTKETIASTNFSLFHGALKLYANNYIYAHEPVDVSRWERLGEGTLADYADSCPESRRSETREAVGMLAAWIKKINREYKDRI